MLTSCEEINYSFDRARRAFKDITYPAWRQALIDKANESDVLFEVFEVLWHLPDREYSSADDAINELDNIQNIVQPFICLDYPVTRERLIEAAREFNSPIHVMDALYSCPDKVYDSVSEVINSCTVAYLSGKAGNISI